MKRKSSQRKKLPALRRTPQSEFVVRIIAVGLGLFVVLFVKQQFSPAQGESLGTTTLAQKTISPEVTPTVEVAENEFPRIKVYTRNRKLVMHELGADDNEIELDASQMEIVKKQLDTNHIIVTPLDDHMLTIQRGNVATITELPLIIDESDYSYTVETSGGKIMVTHLPNDVIQDLINGKTLDSVQTSENTNPVGKVRLVIKLKQDDSGSAIFEVKGKRKKKLFGVIPVVIDKTVTVSSQSGELLLEDFSFVGRILNFLSV